MLSVLQCSLAATYAQVPANGRSRSAGVLTCRSRTMQAGIPNSKMYLAQEATAICD
jgi:hypothetical protein